MIRLRSDGDVTALRPGQASGFGGGSVAHSSTPVREQTIQTLSNTVKTHFRFTNNVRLFSPTFQRLVRGKSVNSGLHQAQGTHCTKASLLVSVEFVHKTRNKIGKYWDNIPDYEQRGRCPLCDGEEESM